MKSCLNVTLLTLPLLLAACGGAGTPGAPTLSVTADRNTVTLTPGGESTPPEAAVTFTFKNQAGAPAAVVDTATIMYGASGTFNLPLAAFTVPAGLSCATGSTTGCSTADLRFSEKTFARVIADADLFGTLPGLNPGQTTLPVKVSFPGVAGTLAFTVKIAAPAGPVTGTPVTAPTPVLSVNGTGTPPYSGNLSVTVSGNFDAASTIDKLILQVTAADGSIDNTTYVSNQPSATFSVDTSRYPDGAVTLQALAITRADATSVVLRGKSAEKTVTVQNITAPQISVASPLEGSTFTGAVLPVSINVTRKNSEFTVTGGQLRVDLLDYRGQSVAQKLISGVSDNVSGNYATTFDVAALPADIYTVRVQADVAVAGGTAQTTTTVSSLTIGTRSINPPAVVIRIPTALRNPADTSQPLRAIMNSASGVLLNLSDDKGISNVQVRLVRPDGTPLNSYLLNQGFNPPFLGPIELTVGPFDIDGSQYVPNGNYSLRVTVADNEGNRNIQEVPVTIDRAVTVNGLNQAAAGQDPSVISGKLNFNSGTWTLSGLPAAVNRDLSGSARVAGLLFKDGVQIGTKYADLQGDPSVSYRAAFTASGEYRVDWLVEDLNTGAVRYLTGPQITVITNP